MPRKKPKLVARKPRKLYKQLPAEVLDSFPTNPQMDTPEQRRARLDHYFSRREDGVNFDVACRDAGFSVQAFCRWVTNNADLAAENEASKKRRRVKLVEDFQDIAQKAKNDPRFNAIFLALLKHEGIIKDDKMVPDEVEAKKYIFEVVNGSHPPA